MKEAFSTLLEVGGLVALCYGLWLAWPPLAPVVGGLLVIAFAQGVGRSRP